MRHTLIILIIFIFIPPAYAKRVKSPSSQKERAAELVAKMAQIEIFDNKPKRPYVIIAPLHESSGTGLITRRSQETLFVNMKKKAAKMDADAIIDLNCGANRQLRSYANTNWGFSKTADAPYCSGTAVRWR